MPKAKKIKVKKFDKLPKIFPGTPNESTTFPVDHYSASALMEFSRNPIMFKIKYINRDRFENTHGVSSVIGNAFHQAMEVYYRGNPDMMPIDNAQAIEFGLKSGMEFLENYEDGFIEYTDNIQNKQKTFDLFSFLFNSYIKEKPYDPTETLIMAEKQIEALIDVDYQGERLVLPIKLKGKPDKVIRDKENRIIIKDYKTCRSFTPLDKIDGKKIIQCIQYFFLVYFETKEKPYSFVYEEAKMSKNQDGSPQVREYEIVYADHQLYFDFYFRFYHDITDALNGKQVYVPNIDTFYDNELSILFYAHRLDEPEEKAKQMKKLKVDNITDLLKKKIQSAGNMRRLLKAVEDKFVTGANLNYERMTNEEKIKVKLLEHGMMLDHEKTISGASVDLYRYTPSIGLKMSRLSGYVADVEQVLGISGIRILAPIPGSTLVGFEVPRSERVFPSKSGKSNNLVVGVDILGKDVELIIEEMPHLLVAGTTGSGKSHFLNSAIGQLTGKYNITILDPKGIDFSGGINEHIEIVEELEHYVAVMKNRYKIMQGKGLRRWSDTGNKSDVIIIDEYNDLCMSKEKIPATKSTKRGEPKPEPVGTIVEHNVKLLAQKARAAGIHLIVATQRPSVKVIDGDIKANFPTRICFRLPTSTDSQVVLDVPGAEKLLGKGDGLLLKDGFINRFQSFNN